MAALKVEKPDERPGRRAAHYAYSAALARVAAVKGRLPAGGADQKRRKHATFALIGRIRQENPVPISLLASSNVRPRPRKQPEGLLSV